MSNIERITLRNILPAETFDCGIDNVPFKTNEYHGNGGYMGEYVPTVDFPFVNILPLMAMPYIQADSCLLPTS